MEVLSHRANSLVSKYLNIREKLMQLNYLSNNKLVDGVELDFNLSKDGEFVLSHSNYFCNKPLSYYNMDELRKNGFISLEDLLNVICDELKILVDFKVPLNEETKKYYDSLFDVLKNSRNKILLQSFKKNLIMYLLNKKDKISNVDVGIVINFFKSYGYNLSDLKDFKDVDFISLSSEHFENNIMKKNYKYYRDIFPNASQYAWIWSPPYIETNKRYEKYISCGVDGIITNYPEKVKKLSNRG